MRRQFFLLLICFIPCLLAGQQFYLEAFTGRNRPKYDLPQYSGRASLIPAGLKIAAGLDHAQIGAEYATTLIKASLQVKDDSTDNIKGSHRFRQTYMGLFVRGKISRYPARRFGLTLTAGAGLMGLERTSNVEGEPTEISYKKTPSFNFGAGISVPTQGMGMFELGYYYYHARLKEEDGLAAMRASSQAIRLGYSINLVFGKRAADYEKIRKF